MAHLSGTFADASPGRLILTLSGDFVQGVRRDAGFPAGASDMLLRASVNGVKTPALSRDVPTVTFEIPGYPGGNVSWPISTEVLSYVQSGTGSFGFQNLSIVVRLEKK